MTGDTLSILMEQSINLCDELLIVPCACVLSGMTKGCIDLVYGHHSGVIINASSVYIVFYNSIGINRQDISFIYGT